MREQRQEYFVVATPGAIRLGRRGPGSAMGGQVKLYDENGDGIGPVGGRAGRQIREFTRQSRRNMHWRIASIPWAEVGPKLAMVTLTYPREFPMDGRRVKRHHNRFHLAWCREWGRKPEGVWKLEFQERGAPHLHHYLGRPDVRVDEFRDWALSAWDRIVASGDPRHAERGVDVRPCRFDTAEKNAMRVGEYFWRHNAKASVNHTQNIVPEGYEEVGRFWGVWGVRPVEHETVVSRAEYVALRRPTKQLAAVYAYGHREPKPRGLNGFWTVAQDGVASAVRLVDWASEASGAERSEANPDLCE